MESIEKKNLFDLSEQQKKNNLFLYCARTKNTTYLRKLLSNNEIDVNTIDEYGKNVLFYVGWNESIVQDVLTRGVRVLVEDKDKKNPFFFVTNGCVARKLLESPELKGNKNLQKSVINCERGGVRPILLGTPDVVSVLVEYDADIDVRDRNNNNPFHLNWSIYTFKDLVKKLETRKEKLIDLLKAVNNEGDMPIHAVVNKFALDRNEIIEEMYKWGIDVNEKQKENSEEMAPLHLAVKHWQHKTVIFLMKNKDKFKLDLNIKDKNGDMPLDLAKKMGDPLMVELLEGKMSVDLE